VPEFIAGTEAGDSKREVQKWIPVKKPPRPSRYMPGHQKKGDLIQRGMVEFVRRGMVIVWDGDRRLEPGKDYGTQNLLKFLKGKRLTAPGGRELTSQDLSVMIGRYLDEWKAAWKRVDASSAQLGNVDQVGQGSNSDEHARYIESQEQQFLAMNRDAA
jgi:hypothetical protein